MGWSAALDLWHMSSLDRKETSISIREGSTVPWITMRERCPSSDGSNTMKTLINLE